MWRIASALLLLAAASSAAAAPAGKPLFRGADPDTEVIAGEVWAFPTNARGGDKLLAWSSPDLARWSQRGVLLDIDDVAWVKADGARTHYLWAPDMVPANGRWYLYYSVGPQNPTPSRLGVATCTGPAGPCTDIGKPLITGGDGFEAIDPMVFTDPKSKQTYLYAGGSAGSTLRAWVLKPDMTSIEREVRVAQPPLFTEAVFVHERQGVYYLSYSHGRWEHSSYSVHYATGPSPLGPWTYRGPLLQSSARLKGPGHHSFFKGTDGVWRIAYHGWPAQRGDGPYRGDRYIVVQPIAYDAAGAIRLDSAAKSGD